jgi:hypothetical protein
MINRRDFMAIGAANAIGLQVKSTGPSRSPKWSQIWRREVESGTSSGAQEVAGHTGDQQDPVELMLDKLFGNKRNEPTPLPSITHLDPADFFFVAFTDAHIGPADLNRWMGYLIIYNWRVEEVIRHINALNPEFAIHIGDSIWGSPWDPNDEVYIPAAQTASQIFGKLKCPFHNVAGTHDFGMHYRPTNDPDAPAPSGLDTGLYTKYFGEIFYSFEIKKCRFIVYNNALAKVNSPDAIRQDQWLKAELPKASNSELAFFFSHEPFFWLSPDENGDESVNVYLQPARAELLKRLATNGVDFVYSGHTHFEFGNRYGNMYLHTLNSCSNNRDFLATSGTPYPFPVLAQIHDPYKFGYLIVRVRDGKVHESWVSTYWRVNDSPRELAPISGSRPVSRPASEVDDSVLGVVAAPPPEVVKSGDAWFSKATRSLVNDHAWRLGENIGSKWLQSWPIPSSAQEWSCLERGLTLGAPRGVKIAVPLPADIVAMGQSWARLSSHEDTISAVVVCNGAPAFFPTLYNPELTTWKVRGIKEEWIQGCLEAKRLVPESTRVMLGRLPLRQVHFPSDPHISRGSAPDLSSSGEPGSGLSQFKDLAAALSNKADGVVVWIRCNGQPEEFAEEIATAARISRAYRLELWLDAAGWEYIDESLRAAYFLRLIALCQANGVHLFWWNGPEHEGGLLDGFYDPTQMYYAAQAWQALVDPPAEPVKVELGESVRLRWKDKRGREHAVWWRPSEQLTIDTAWTGFDLPSGGIALDPVHGRFLRLSSAGPLPLCSWPLIWRGK